MRNCKFLEWNSNGRAVLAVILVTAVISGYIFGISSLIKWTAKQDQEDRAQKKVELTDVLNKALEREAIKNRNKVYAEAVENGVGEWVVIDSKGTTEFKWKKND